MFNFIYNIIINHFEKKLQIQKQSTLNQKEIEEIDKDLQRLSQVREKLV